MWGVRGYGAVPYAPSSGQLAEHPSFLPSVCARRHAVGPAVAGWARRQRSEGAARGEFDHVAPVAENVRRRLLNLTQSGALCAVERLVRRGKGRCKAHSTCFQRSGHARQDPETPA